MPVVNFSHLSFGTFFGVYISGVITSLTPCVYPIIPIIIGFIGSRSGSTAARVRGSVFYVLGLALVYTLLGMTAALSGRMFGSMTSNPYVYLGFGVLMMVLGGNMMDWYAIPLPGMSGTAADKGDTIFAPFFLGVSTGLVASPCTAPVLGGLLMMVSAQKAIISGGLLMFTFSLGMCTILLLLGFSASLVNYLPKSGVWMVRVKKALALLLIGVGVYFVFMAGRLS